MNCSQHPQRPAVYKCDNCGEPICQSCYDDFEMPDNGGHLCANCYKEELRHEAAEAKALKGMVTREFVFIIIGLLVGLFFGLDIMFGFGVITDVPTHNPVGLIFLPFIFGSLLTIIKKIKNEYVEQRDEGSDTNWITLIFVIIINLLFSPIMTIMRFFQRIGDMRNLNRIYAQDVNAIIIIDNYLARSLQPSAVAAVAGGESEDVEISLESILASGAGSDKALCDNGEILRTVRTR